MNTNRTIETGVAVAKDEPVRVSLELGARESAGSSRERSLIRRTGRNSISIGWGFRSFLSEIAAYCSARAQVAGHSEPPLYSPVYIFVIIDLSKHRWRSINGTFKVSPP